MGVTDWKIDCCQALIAEGIDLIQPSKKIACYQFASDYSIYLLNLQHTYSSAPETPNERFGLQINLWEDVWKTKRSQVISRIKSLAGLNQTIHARKSKTAIIDQQTAIKFLNEHHLLGHVRAKYAVGLLEEGKLVAIATFNMRKMPSRGANYLSAELVRTCTFSGYTVAGGLSKLLQYFVKTYQPNDVMTYADKDWSDGKSYLKLGFTLVGETPPLHFYVDPSTCKRYTLKQLPISIAAIGNDIDAQLAALGYMPIFNSGNKKYVWFIK